MSIDGIQGGAGWALVFFIKEFLKWRIWWKTNQRQKRDVG